MLLHPEVLDGGYPLGRRAAQPIRKIRPRGVGVFQILLRQHVLDHRSAQPLAHQHIK
jgi:hypothetical protein